MKCQHTKSVSRNMHQKIKSVGNTRMACLYVIDSISWGKLTAWLRRISASKRRLDTVKSVLGSLYKWKPSHQESNCEESRSASNNSPGSLREIGGPFSIDSMIMARGDESCNELACIDSDHCNAYGQMMQQDVTAPLWSNFSYWFLTSYTISHHQSKQWTTTRGHRGQLNRTNDFFNCTPGA